MEIVPYSTAHREAIDRMNQKLSAAGSEFRFPADEPSDRAEALPIRNDRFVAVDGGEAYGGYILKRQHFFVEGRPQEDVGNLQLPLSLGQVDGAFGHVSAALLIDVLRRSPRCYSIGLGSEDTQFAKLLGAAGWEHTAVPFYFSVKSGNRFARSIRLGPDRRRMQTALRALGRLRLAGVALRLRDAVRSKEATRPRRRTPAVVQEIQRFDPSVDELFAAHASAYSLLGDRRSAALNAFYPEENRRFTRIVVREADRTIGWAVLLDTQMRDDKYFGDMRVGALVDCFAALADAPDLVAAADGFLTRRGVDVVVSNQLHPVWGEALRAVGYERGPSNFFFYYSPALAEALTDAPDWLERVHMNRGDGEGPTHL